MVRVVTRVGSGGLSGTLLFCTLAVFLHSLHEAVLFFRQQMVDLRNQLQQFVRVLLDCGLFAQFAPTFSGFALHPIKYPQSCI
jgi:hypothetical protein